MKSDKTSAIEKIRSRRDLSAERVTARRRSFWRVAFAFIAIAGSVAGCISALPILREWAKPAAAVRIAVPKAARFSFDSKKQTVLGNQFDQRFFYFIDRKKVDPKIPFLVDFPFALYFDGPKRLEHASVSIVFKHANKGLHYKAPSLAEKVWPFFRNIPMDTANLTGRGELRRTLAITHNLASVSYTGLELVPGYLSHFEFKFSPQLYLTSIAEGGSAVEIGAYEVRINVLAEDFSQSFDFVVMVLPGTDEKDFETGVLAYSTLFGCQALCRAPWVMRQIHRMPWAAKHFSNEIEDVVIYPEVKDANIENANFRVLTIGEKVKVNRYVQIVGGARENPTGTFQP